MSGERIQLAKSIDKDKYEYPLLGSEKLDGCAAEFYWLDGRVVNMSRNVKVRYTSVGHIEKYLEETLPKGMQLIVELYIPGMHFKDSSGPIRAEAADTRIRAGIYDCLYAPEGDPCPYLSDKEFTDRYMQAVTYFPCWASPVFTIEHRRMNDRRSIDLYYESLRSDNPDVFEGMVLRKPDELFNSGKRRMFRHTFDPTTDLVCMSFEEAISKEGDALGRVGRINGRMDNGVVTGVGAGRMTHVEAKYCWEHQDEFIGVKFQAKHKRDTSYVKLRAPTFQLWRYDL